MSAQLENVPHHLSPACPMQARCEDEATELARARAGNRPAFDALFERYFARVYREAQRRSGSRPAAERATRAALAAAFLATSPRVCMAVDLLRALASLGQPAPKVDERPAHQVT
jgi:hypothetical protein